MPSAREVIVRSRTLPAVARRIRRCSSAVSVVGDKSEMRDRREQVSQYGRRSKCCFRPTGSGLEGQRIARGAASIHPLGGGIPTVPSKRAHQELIERHLCWDRIEERLELFPAIGVAFPLRTLRAASRRSPYYSHYMTLRLSSWPVEVPFFHAPFFERFDILLRGAVGIDGWEREKSIRSDPDYGAFWSLLWQLQVMEWLLGLGAQLRWNGPGPDLTATIAGNAFDVECTVVRGQSAQREYADDLLKLIHPTLRLGPARFPNGGSALNIVFDALVKDVERWWPGAQISPPTDPYGTPILELRRPGYSVRSVPLDGLHPIFPGDHAFVRDDPELPSRELRKVISKKEGKNRSSGSRPTVLAVNFLLNHDFQLNLLLQRGSGLGLEPTEWPGVDSILVSTCGIDRPLRESFARFVRVSERIPEKVRKSVETDNT